MIEQIITGFFLMLLGVGIVALVIAIVEAVRAVRENQ